MLRLILAAAMLAALALPLRADEIADAIAEAQKAYQAGDLAKAKQQLELASQLVGQKNAETFAKLLPEPLPGWTADKAESSSVGVSLFSASTATRRYTDSKGRDVQVRITGDSALVTQFAQFLINPSVAGIVGKLIRVGNERAMQTVDGTINMVIAGKFLVTIDGSADIDGKLAYAKAVDVARLSKM